MAIPHKFDDIKRPTVVVGSNRRSGSLKHEIQVQKKDNLNGRSS